MILTFFEKKSLNEHSALFKRQPVVNKSFKEISQKISRFEYINFQLSDYESPL